jgi:hypothetical protein
MSPFFPDDEDLALLLPFLGFPFVPVAAFLVTRALFFFAAGAFLANVLAATAFFLGVLVFAFPVLVLDRTP